MFLTPTLIPKIRVVKNNADNRRYLFLIDNIVPFFILTIVISLPHSFSPLTGLVPSIPEGIATLRNACKDTKRRKAKDPLTLNPSSLWVEGKNGDFLR